MEGIRELAQFLTTLCCGLFAGAAIYINLVEHPARMECGTEIAATEFGPSYRRAAVMQASLAATGLAASMAAWLTGASVWWLAGGILLGSVIPFTLVVIILSTNNCSRRHSIKVPHGHGSYCANGASCTR